MEQNNRGGGGGEDVGRGLSPLLPRYIRDFKLLVYIKKQKTGVLMNCRVKIKPKSKAYTVNNIIT